MESIDVIAKEISNVGLTILVFVVGVLVVNWLDRNVFNKGRRKD